MLLALLDFDILLSSFPPSPPPSLPPSFSSSRQFADHEFAGLSGARVVRIATHPDFQGMGYGSRALELLLRYYQGEVPCLEEADASTTMATLDTPVRE